MNYRKFYEKETGHAIPIGYEIHHIDENRDNNKIYNLVMIPKELHEKLHKNFNELKRFGIQNVLQPSNDYRLPYFELLENHCNNLREVNKYVRLRDVMLNGFSEFMAINNAVLSIYNEIYPF